GVADLGMGVAVGRAPGDEVGAVGGVPVRGQVAAGGRGGVVVVVPVTVGQAVVVPLEAVPRRGAAVAHEVPLVQAVTAAVGVRGAHLYGAEGVPELVGDGVGAETAGDCVHPGV